MAWEDQTVEVIAAHGGRTLDEMAAMLGLSAKSTMHTRLKLLEKQGAIYQGRCQCCDAPRWFVTGRQEST